MLPHIVPYDESRVIEDQPWLSPEEHESLHQAGRAVIGRMFDDEEPWMREHLLEMAGQGDQAAVERLNPFCRFILTTDYRIVQEINVFRWGHFLERAHHRMIERTVICNGSERERDRDGPPPKNEVTYVSTVFIGMGENELFETMIFGGWYNGVPWRSQTLLDAKKCHFEAVLMARQLRNYMKRHGKARRKDWIRIARFWELAHKRGQQWAEKQVAKMAVVEQRLHQIPYGPPTPQGDPFFDLAQRIIGRHTLAKNPLL